MGKNQSVLFFIKNISADLHAASTRIKKIKLWMTYGVYKVNKLNIIF